MKNRLAICVMGLAVCAAALGDFKEERMSRAYQAAMADYTAGRLDAATDGFEKAVQADGENASARFQLACLLHDHRRDYLGAVCNYREYLRLAKASDKADLARERIALCERELAVELAKKYELAGGEAQARESSVARSELEAAERRLAAAEKELSGVKARAETLEKENARLRRMVSSVGGDAASGAKPRTASARDVLDDDDDQPAARPGLAAAKAVLEAVEADEKRTGMDIAAAKAVLADDDGVSSPRGRIAASGLDGDDGDKGGVRANLAEAKAVLADDDGAESPDESARIAEARALADDAEQGASSSLLEATAGDVTPVQGGKLTDFANRTSKKTQAKGARPETYTVQEGDTLYKIALRFYGRTSAWKDIRDANKATITTDGRVNSGQTIILP